MQDVPIKPSCFIAIPYRKKFDELKKIVTNSVYSAGYKAVSLDQSPIFPSNTIQEALNREITHADCIIADVTTGNPNIFFELGLAQAMSKSILLIAHESNMGQIPFDLRSFRISFYSDSISSKEMLARNIKTSLEELSQYPRQPSPISKFPLSLPFFMDWESLTPRDAENLCQELLSQMGFRNLYWEKEMREIDLIAEYPRKDPDGFEFREQWFVCMGKEEQMIKLFDIASIDPRYIFKRLTHSSNKFEKTWIEEKEGTLTLLFIFFKKNPNSNEIQYMRSRMDRRDLLYSNDVVNWRFRIWDQHYLTSLVQRYPHIGYKYFSEEGRIRSKTRKTYEELYKENSSLTARLTNLISELKEEKDRRIRAERDTIWKDVSFSAAHKIGNPIFAIETDLDPLRKRISEDRKSEAMEVVDNIRSAVEKAKATVEQFKSLAKAQEITQTACPLLPILKDACKPCLSEKVVCSVKCPDSLTVLGDPIRLAECFDELIMNALHWLYKSNKKINIIAEPILTPPPDFLDSSKKYAFIRVSDNGCGIPVADKEKIFDAFHTTYEHGTGLGLALVRRIIDGHGGRIIESGIPQKGAEFEIYLPMIDENEKYKLKRVSSRNKRSKK